MLMLQFTRNRLKQAAIRILSGRTRYFGAFAQFVATLRDTIDSTTQEWPHVLVRPAGGAASDIQLQRTWQLQRQTRIELSDSICTPPSKRDDGASHTN
jgi:hypothetical protein